MSTTHPTYALAINGNAPDVPGDAPPPGAGETPWYSGSTHPVQIGVYARLSLAGGVMYSFWDGGKWCWQCRTPDLAVRRTDASLIGTLPWRGLRQPSPQGYGPVLQRTEAAPC